MIDNDSDGFRAAEEWKQAILDAIDPIDVISQWVDRIRVSSRGWIQGECPFPHDGSTGTDKKRRFGMRMDRSTGYSFLCFRCGEHGSIFDVVMKMTGCTFWQAMENLAERYGVPRPDEKLEPGVINHGTIQGKLRSTAETCHNMLVANAGSRTGPNAEYLDYLIDERGLDMETIVRFKIGYLGHQKAKQNPPNADILVATGFWRKDKNNSLLLYPTIDDAITIPVYRGSQVINMTMRRIRPSLYTLRSGEVKERMRHCHVQPIRSYFNGSACRGDEVYVNEGPMDAISYEQHGFPACAILGAKSFRESHVSRFNNEGIVYLSFDADGAGRPATYKVAKALMSAGIWNIRVVTFDLPEGETKIDANTYFKTHSREDFLKRRDVVVEDIVTWMLRIEGIEKPSGVVLAMETIKKVRPIVEIVAPCMPLAREMFLGIISSASGLSMTSLRQEAGAAGQRR